MNYDTISREAAIAAADRADYPGLAVEDVKAVTDEVVKELKKLPSVEQQGQWVPITERLPEKEGTYLVSCKGEPPIEFGHFYIDEDGEKYFCCIWSFQDEIQAWMPLPTPYKGDMNLKELLKQSVDNEDLLPDLPQENKDKNTEIVKAYKEGYEQGKKDAERHGKWIDAECYSEGCDDGYICSECRRITYRTMTAYCPNCGAKME